MNKKAKLMFVIALLATIGGIGAHLYLTNHHYEFKYGNGAEGGFCNISSAINCDTTTASRYSEIFGIPVSILGGLVNFFFLILLLLYRFPLVKRETQIALGSPLKLISLGIFGVSVIMGFISYVMLKTVCPACSSAYFFSFLSFIATWMMVTEKPPLFTKLDVKIYPAILIGTLALGFVMHKNNMQAYGGDKRLKIIKLQFEAWKNAPQQTITPVDALVMHPNPDSKMKLVEFADFLCGHCATAYPTIHRFVKKHADVEFSFQAWPLDGECNTKIPHAEGTRCLLARVSHCAEKQNKTWDVQSWIFKNQPDLMSKDQVSSQLKDNASDLGINLDELNACTETEEVREAIRQQAKLGADLNINGTPSLFINGRKVPPGFSVMLLEMIYSHLNQ